MLRASTLMLLALLVGVSPSCKRCGVDGRGQPRTAREKSPPVPLGPASIELRAPEADQHRILLDAASLAELRAAAKRRDPAWLRVEARCDEDARRNVESGYQGFEWAGSVASLALCWNATGNATHAAAGLRYLNALLDDRFRVGDGRGGTDVVTHDSGYGTRTFAAYAALGYDWLRGAPGMDAAVRDRVVQRLERWLSWYGTHGYLRDEPFSNYYWGYLTALSFAGLALSGEYDGAKAWLSRARDELSARVLPAFRDHLTGGGWPEGWQYGEYTTLEIALVARAFRTGAGIDVIDRLPWLGKVVTHHVHALLPDQRSVYDGGTWGEHPAVPSALALCALSFVLEGSDEPQAARARWLTEHALPPLSAEHAWVGLLAARSQPKAVDPRRTEPRSLSLPGTGLTFARSDWTSSAVWTSFQAGPFLTPDHQDKDQGHFEIWRGGDGLLVDGGDAEGSATINHNAILIEDGGKNLVYHPNQGVWGSRVRTTAFGDDGAVVVARGDIEDAYAPPCVEDGCSRQSVEKLVRTFVYVRPDLLVLHDDLKLADPSFGATWIAHVSVDPRTEGALASAQIGSSRVDVRMLEPENLAWRSVREPTASGEGPHRQNHPWGPMWRIEADSPRGRDARSFLAVIGVDRRDAKPRSARRVVGDHLRGTVTRAGSDSVAILFTNGAENGRADLAEHVDAVIVVGAPPGEKRRVATHSGADCSVAVTATADASGTPASPGGFVRVAVPPCTR